MTMKLAINGFGRIGRLLLRHLFENAHIGEDMELIALSASEADAKRFAYQLKFDTTQRPFPMEISTQKSSPDAPMDDVMVIGGKNYIQCLKGTNDPKDMPWKKLGVDYVIECTGRFTKKDQLKGHLEAGAKKVILSAPGKGGIKMLLMGINHRLYDPETDHIISNSSCTTNCLAPLVYVLVKEGIGIESGLMTTVHSYTASQNLVDGSSGKDWRSGRAGALNIIPATTGAAQGVGAVIPEVAGILTGMSFRVPVPTGSVVDLTVSTRRDSSIEEIDQLMKKASETYLDGILEYQTDPIVSSDVIHNKHASVYDSTATLQFNLENEPRHFKIISWYDNEWGYAHSLYKLTQYIGERDGVLDPEKPQHFIRFFSK